MDCSDALGANNNENVVLLTDELLKHDLFWKNVFSTPYIFLISGRLLLLLFLGLLKTYINTRDWMANNNKPQKEHFLPQPLGRRLRLLLRHKGLQHVNDPEDRPSSAKERLGCTSSNGENKQPQSRLQRDYKEAAN